MAKLRLLTALTIITIMLLAAYPVIELSRSIIVYNIIPMESGASVFWISTWDKLPTLNGFYLELALIWGLYICIPFIIERVINLAWLEGKNETKNGTANRKRSYW